jgi:hypothetical protein
MRSAKICKQTIAPMTIMKTVMAMSISASVKAQAVVRREPIWLCDKNFIDQGRVA